MTLDQLLGIVRSLLIVLAGVAVGHGIGQNVYEAFSGFVVAAVTLGWGVTQHDADLGQFLSVIRGAIAALGGYAVQRGWATADQVTLWTGAAVSLAPAVWSYIAHAPAALPPAPPSASSGSNAPPAPSSAAKTAGVVSMILRRARLVFVFAVAAPLAACSALGLTGTTQQNTATIIADAQLIAKNLCAVVPSATAIASIVAVNNPALATGTQIAGAICAAVTSSPNAVAARMKSGVITTIHAPVNVGGVRVDFVS